MRCSTSPFSVAICCRPGQISTRLGGRKRVNGGGARPRLSLRQTKCTMASDGPAPMGGKSPAARGGRGGKGRGTLGDPPQKWELVRLLPWFGLGGVLAGSPGRSRRWHPLPALGQRSVGSGRPCRYPRKKKERGREGQCSAAPPVTASGTSMASAMEGRKRAIERPSSAAGDGLAPASVLP